MGQLCLLGVIGNWSSLEAKKQGAETSGEGRFADQEQVCGPYGVGGTQYKQGGWGGTLWKVSSCEEGGSAWAGHSQIRQETVDFVQG